MRLSGKIFMDGTFWLAEIPMLDVMTQGHTKKEAYEMVVDLLKSLHGNHELHIELYKKIGGEFEIGFSSLKELIPLLLRRKREMSGLSLSQVAQRLGSSSRNAYARYEQGQSVPSVEKLNELLHALSPDTDIVLSESKVA
ncbi:MAG: helix-turn-helix transcriptional regulator [Nitrospinae bacterium]|nr:helix-turn-helix transcriptional regulator [Nitrospinota bacterium]